MGKISIDLSTIKAAGIYTIEVDGTQREISNPTALRLLVGFNNKGSFNRPVFLQYEEERQKLFGDIDNKLEQKGCYFNRMAQTMLENGPILALNLLKVDDSVDGPDQVNYAAMSLDACKPNPRVVSAGKVYGEYDYQADTINKVLYGTQPGDSIPYVGKTPYSSLFDRSRFWVPSHNNLMAVAANGLQTNDDYTFEHTNFMNFANTGTDEISILVYKPEGIKGYDITAKEWYGGDENIPYGWIRPSDYISDYFIRVVAVKGNWSNYPILSSDAVWGKYFDKDGIKKDKVSAFCSAEGITFLGSWSGVIIPDFVDKQGNYLYIKDKVNAATEQTGLLMAINEDAMQVISYDKNGVDVETGNENGVGSWVFDFDGNNEADSDAGEFEIGSNGYLIDMVGHNLQDGIFVADTYLNLVHPLDKDNKNGKIPAYWLIKTNATPDSDACVMSFYGRDIEGEPLNPTAKLPVITSVTDPEYVYTVFDATTNKKINSPYCYVHMKKAEAEKYLKDKDKLPTSTKVYTDNIKDSTSKILSEDGVLHPSVKEHNFYLKNTSGTDNFVYEYQEVYYGTYAIYNSKENDVKILNVSEDPKTGLAIVTDVSLITTNSLVNNLVSNTVSVLDYKNAAPHDVAGYEFMYAGGEYFVSSETGEFYMKQQTNVPTNFGVNFMSYNYLTENVNEVITDVYNVRYFNGYKNTKDIYSPINLEEDTSMYENGQNPVSDTNLNMFICTNELQASLISVGHYVNNITFYNNVGESTKYNLIPGVTKITRKIFVNVDASREFYYNGKKFRMTADLYDVLIKTRTGKRGFYLFTAIDPVYISDNNYITRQLPITDNIISKTLKFIPMKGLHISAKHRPGFDEYGRVSIEDGIKKIYSMLDEDGIKRGLCNKNMVDYRYIVDSMSYGLSNELGGKVYLSRLAQYRMKCTALLNLPSKKQFELSSNPCFCDSYIQGSYIKPPFNTKYIPMGGNSDLYNTQSFSLPTEDDGSKFAAAFWPNLIYNVNGREISVPPAADVCDVFIRKFTGGDPYVVAANRNGIIRNNRVTKVEFMADDEDRGYLEPMGVNTIIQNGNNIIIYGNQTCYQDTISDFNKLHVRENLNTLEIACEAVLDTFNFLYNTPAVRAQIVTALTPILETMKLSQAIEWYEIQCDEKNNTPDLIEDAFGIVDLKVIVSQGLEKIVNRITLKRRSDVNV